MKNIFIPVFFIALFISGCNKKELDKLQSQNIEANSVSQFKSLMINNTNEDNIISKIEGLGDSYSFILEDSTTISFNKSFIKTLNYDSANWKCIIKFNSSD